MKTVRIYGMAPNLTRTPPPEQGEEVWLSNWHKGYLQRLPRALTEWTRYFNLHSKRHQLHKYPLGHKWYQENAHLGRIVLRDPDPDIPGSEVFPRDELQAYFSTAEGKPQRYFTCSVCWFIALVIWERETGQIPWERIELWGFEVRPSKPKYAFERPCIFYWINLARKHGIEVWLPPELRPEAPEGEAGDPNAYDGPLYGYETT
jgi:hypothetical protein